MAACAALTLVLSRVILYPDENRPEQRVPGLPNEVADLPKEVHDVLVTSPTSLTHSDSFTVHCLLASSSAHRRRSPRCHPAAFHLQELRPVAGNGLHFHWLRHCIRFRATRLVRERTYILLLLLPGSTPHRHNGVFRSKIFPQNFSPGQTFPAWERLEKIFVYLGFLKIALEMAPER